MKIDLHLPLMGEKINELLTKSSSLFMTYGIKSLTMNDISSRLGISKKTLYNYVSDKNDLVYKCIDLIVRENECEIASLCQSAENAIEELFAFSRFAGEQISAIHPSIFFDLQKYHPEAWAHLNSFEEKTILEVTKRNLIRGVDEGLFRKDFNVNLIAQIYLSMVQNIFYYTPKLLAGLTLADYYKNMFDYHIRGIASENGIKLINQHNN
ncbi:MAG: AcrR family transcriptional regulator [Salibacteraceae bacterium]